MAEQADEENRGRGSRPIGSLARGVVNSLGRTVTTISGSSEKLPTAGTTTTRRATSSPITTLPGEPGYGTRQISHLVATASAADLHRDPAVLLPQSVTSCLAAAWTDGDTGHGWDGYVGRYELTAEPPDRDLAVARLIADEALLPSPERMVLAELARLRALTVSRDQSTTDLELIAAAYTDELVKYPPDAVKEVLREWPRSQRFWPSMAELTERLERLVKPRRALREALRNGYRAPQTSPDWIAPPSEADKAAVTELLAEHGLLVDDAGRVRRLENEPLSRGARRRVAEETARFRLLDDDDPRVQARLQEMGP